MNGKCIFSIIVPVYNIQEYICECIESVLQQNFTDYELLLIDDGSVDGSGEICDKYAKKDRRIKVIHNENSGAASARNTGIRIAGGEWIIFLDGDDYYFSNCFLADIYEIVREQSPQIICYGVKEVRDEDRSLVKSKDMKKIRFFQNLDEDEKLSELISKGLLGGAAWQYAVSHSFLLEHALFFDETFKSAGSEDTEWVFRLFLEGGEDSRISLMDKTKYYYRIRANSACTKERKSGFWRNRYRMIEITLNNIKIWNCSVKRKKLLCQRLAYEYYVLLGQVNDEPDILIRKELLKNMYKFNELCSYTDNWKINICMFIVKLTGLFWGAKILHFYSRCRARNKMPVHKNR